MLVATDIASRGIDVLGIELVVNFDLPSTSHDYVHRIGRTARAGAAGRAVTFAAPSQQKDLREIERLIRKRLSVSKLPEMEKIKFSRPIRPARDFFDQSRSGRFGHKRSTKDRSSLYQQSPERKQWPLAFLFGS